MLTRPFLAILFLACLIDSGQTLTLSHDNQILFDLIFQQDSIKLFSWNMGSSYCRAGETSPKCDSYIKDSVNKLISLGDKYDVICLQGAPKYYKLQQKDLADKLINDFVLKYRYSIVRSGRTDLAILSKFPILNTTDIQVSHYAAKSVSFWAGGSKYQVVNIQNLNNDFSQDFVARKEDIKKILQWMSSNENKGDVNILTGYFYMNYGNIENVIMDVKPFGLNGLPPRSCPGPSYCTLTWGETGWPYTMEKMSNENVQYGMIYTKSFKITDYPPANRAVSIVAGDKFLVAEKYFQGKDNLAMFRQPNYPNNKFILEFNQLGGLRRVISPYEQVKYLYVDCSVEYSKTDTLVKVPAGTGYHPIYWVSDFNKASRFVDKFFTSKLECHSCGEEKLQLNVLKTEIFIPVYSLVASVAPNSGPSIQYRSL